MSHAGSTHIPMLFQMSKTNATFLTEKPQHPSSLDWIAASWVDKDNSSVLREDLLQDELYLTRFIIQKIIGPSVVIFGLLGNILTIIVLTRPSMKSSTNIYLTCLAVYDILYLVFAFTLSAWHFDPHIKTKQWYVVYKWYAGKPLADMCSNTGVWLTLTFTMERYVVVCYPMKGKVWCTMKRAKYVLAIVCTLAAVMTFPELLEYKVVSLNTTYGTIYHQELTDFASYSTYQVGYIHLNQAIFTFLPLLLLIIFNSLLIRAVIKAVQRRRCLGQLVMIRSRRQGQYNKEQQKITVMLIILVLVFLLCQMPQAVQHLFVVYLDVSGRGRRDPSRMTLLKITGNLFNLMVMINASINFVLYSAFSTKFRQTFCRLFCGHPAAEKKRFYVLSKHQKQILKLETTRFNLWDPIQSHEGCQGQQCTSLLDRRGAIRSKPVLSSTALLVTDKCCHKDVNGSTSTL